MRGVFAVLVGLPTALGTTELVHVKMVTKLVSAVNVNTNIDGAAKLVKKNCAGLHTDAEKQCKVIMAGLQDTIRAGYADGAAEANKAAAMNKLDTATANSANDCGPETGGVAPGTAGQLGTYTVNCIMKYTYGTASKFTAKPIKAKDDAITAAQFQTSITTIQDICGAAKADYVTNMCAVAAGADLAATKATVPTPTELKAQLVRELTGKVRVNWTQDGNPLADDPAVSQLIMRFLHEAFVKANGSAIGTWAATYLTTAPHASIHHTGSTCTHADISACFSNSLDITAVAADRLLEESDESPRQLAAARKSHHIAFTWKFIPAAWFDDMKTLYEAGKLYGKQSAAMTKAITDQCPASGTGCTNGKTGAATTGALQLQKPVFESAGYAHVTLLSGTVQGTTAAWTAPALSTAAAGSTEKVGGTLKFTATCAAACKTAAVLQAQATMKTWVRDALNQAFAGGSVGHEDVAATLPAATDMTLTVTLDSRERELETSERQLAATQKLNIGWEFTVLKSVAATIRRINTASNVAVATAFKTKFAATAGADYSAVQTVTLAVSSGSSSSASSAAATGVAAVLFSLLSLSFM